MNYRDSLQSEQHSLESDSGAGRPSHRAGRWGEGAMSLAHLTWYLLLPLTFTTSRNELQQVTMLRLRTLSCALHRQLHTTRSTSLAELGVRAESRLRTWEQRSPLSPSAVNALKEEGATIYVEASEKRVWRDAAYSGVGSPPPSPPRDADGAE